jgi:hypothetical protein
MLPEPNRLIGRDSWSMMLGGSYEMARLVRPLQAVPGRKTPIMHLKLSRERLASLRRLPGWTSLLASRPTMYITLVVAIVAAAYVYSLRFHGIFACSAEGYSSDRYLAECNAPSYGDYEYGGFWFGLEPRALSSAARAEVLFLGDSRLQFAFSTAVMSAWSDKRRTPYYLLGFPDGNVAFLQRLLDRIRPKTKVLVINVDTFFERNLSPFAKVVAGDASAQLRYGAKRFWQRVHLPVCSTVPKLCGRNYVVFRSKATGAYEAHGDYDMVGRRARSAPVSFLSQVDQDKVAVLVASARQFLESSPVDRTCIILTIVPHVGTDHEGAQAVARGLGMALVAPKLNDLQTFDTSHLDRTSAERWSAAFLTEAGPQIEKCLNAS